MNAPSFIQKSRMQNSEYMLTGVDEVLVGNAWMINIVYR